jgi:hypothetical protein
VLGVIPYDPRISAADRTGRALPDLDEDDVLAPFCDIRMHIELLARQPVTR